MGFPKIHLDTARQLLEQYRQQEPFHLYLKHYFREHKKHGSTDRRIIADACYGALRIRAAVPGKDWMTAILIGGWLISERNKDYFLEFLTEPWKSKALTCEDKSLEEKLLTLGVDPEKIFPFESLLSPEVDRRAFALTHLQAPLTWIRLEKEEPVLIKSYPDGISFPEFPKAIGFPPRTDLELLKIPVRYEVQDLSSQETGLWFDPEKGQKWWDCCAGSGGKTLLLRSIQPGLDFYAADIRPQILESLKKRFSKYGFQPRCFEADLSREQSPFYKGFQLQPAYFDRIIADVPCSGSGTWSRSPEQLQTFDPNQLNTLTVKQFNIAQNAARYLKKGGKLFYITCSVFEKENEAVIERLVAGGLKLNRKRYIQGAARRSDTLFIAELQA